MLSYGPQNVVPGYDQNGSEMILPNHANRSRFVSFDLNQPFMRASGVSDPIFHGGGTVLLKDG